MTQTIPLLRGRAAGTGFGVFGGFYRKLLGGGVLDFRQYLIQWHIHPPWCRKAGSVISWPRAKGSGRVELYGDDRHEGRVIGAGEVGFPVASKLASEGHDVTVVESDEIYAKAKIS